MKKTQKDFAIAPEMAQCLAMNTNETTSITTTRRSFSAKLAHKTRRKFQSAAATIPTEIAEAINARAIVGVNSGEPHKATAGWVVSVFSGKGHDICGLLQIASKAVRAAQVAAYNA